MDFFEIPVYAEGEEADVQTEATSAGTEQQAADTSQAAQPGLKDMAVSILPLILIFVIFYFIAIKPQKKREKETQAMIAALKVGDKVVTIGGICGKITKIKDNYVTLETGNIGTPEEKSFIKMERSSIKSVESKQSN